MSAPERVHQRTRRCSLPLLRHPLLHHQRRQRLYPRASVRPPLDLPLCHSGATTAPTCLALVFHRFMPPPRPSTLAPFVHLCLSSCLPLVSLSARARCVSGALAASTRRPLSLAHERARPACVPSPGGGGSSQHARPSQHAHARSRPGMVQRARSRVVWGREAARATCRTFRKHANSPCARCAARRTDGTPGGRVVAAPRTKRECGEGKEKL